MNEHTDPYLVLLGEINGKVSVLPEMRQRQTEIDDRLREVEQEMITTDELENAVELAVHRRCSAVHERRKLKLPPAKYIITVVVGVTTGVVALLQGCN